ncbi:MAG: energy-coupling factor transporter ATPase [Dethiosulfovibrio peptidovorans]|nr:MAG: energy-coupling factor transporter ATPase [Dethiosulfovibrio peptidovorans]
MTAPIVISLEDVEYRYQETDRAALTGISLDVHQGEWLALLGGNGSGKSTLAKHLNALLVPTQGVCRILGWETQDNTHLWDIRRSVSMVFQNPENQIVSTVVEDDTAFGPENLGLSPDDIRERVHRALSIAGLEAKAKAASYTLSGGQKQRLAIAGAIAMETTCMVLDEPTAMLDPQGRREVLDLLTRLHERGVTVVHITHRLEEIVRATRAVVLGEGRILWDGTPNDLFFQPLDQWGLEIPPLVVLWRRLKDAGCIQGEVAPTVESLVSALCPSASNP